MYWNDGGQVLSPYDKEIVEEANQIVTTDMVKSVSDLSSPLISLLDEEIDHAYIEAISHLQNYREATKWQLDLELLLLLQL